MPRSSSVPSLDSWSTTAANLGAGTRSSSVALSAPSPLCRLSEPTKPPAAVAIPVACAAAVVTFSTRTVIDPV
jgi:hypothetical protein